MIRSLWNVNKSRVFYARFITLCRIFADVTIRVASGLGMETDGRNACVGLYQEGGELLSDTLLQMCQHLANVLGLTLFNFGRHVWGLHFSKKVNV